MPFLSPPTLTRPEQDALLQAISGPPRDHLIFSLALGTGLRLSEITGLNVGDLFTPKDRARSRMRLRREIAKGGRARDVFLPDALRPKLVRFWSFKVRSSELRRARLSFPSDHMMSGPARFRLAISIYSRDWAASAALASNCRGLCDPQLVAQVLHVLTRGQLLSRLSIEQRFTNPTSVAG